MAASNTLQPEPSSLRDLLSRHGGLRLVAPERKFHRNEFVEKTDFEGRRDAFAGKCVLIAATEQSTARGRLSSSTAGRPGS